MTIKYISKKLGQTYALWFEASKSFLLVEEPAWDVLQMISGKKPKKDIVQFCEEKYGSVEENIPQFVDEIIAIVRFYNNPENVEVLSVKHSFPKKVKCQRVFETCFYQIGGKIFSVKYGNKEIKHANHLLLAHLETDKNNIPDYELECFEKDNMLILANKETVMEAFPRENFEYYTGTTKQLMYSQLYNKTINDWMGMFHASGIYKNKEAILFSAAAGSGKTTLSALLKAEGFGFLGDDFIAVDKAGKAFPFPSAISVKEGSFDRLSEHYPELLDSKEKTTFIGKTVRFIPVNNLDKKSTKGIPASTLVFVEYADNKSFKFKEISKKEALQLLLSETWINPEPENVSRFLKWVDGLKFYKLRYSEYKDASRVINSFF